MSSVITSAPAKIILFGEHAVVLGKTAIAASVGLRTYVKVEPNKEDFVHVKIQCKDFGNKEYKWGISQIKVEDNLPPVDQPILLPAIMTLVEGLANHQDLGAFKHAVMSILFMYILGSRDRKSGVIVTVDTQVPISVGLGSSAAFNVSLAAAILKFFSIDIGDKSDGDISHSGKELINKWAYQAEKIMHGNPSGIDNTTSTFGGIVAFTGGVVESLEKVPTLHLVVVNTRVPRNTKLLVQKVGLLHNTYPQVSNCLLDCVHNISQTILKLFKEYPQNISDGNTLDTIECHLESFIPINEHVLFALGVGHLILEKVCAIAASYHLQAKLTGAGGGGSAYVFVPRNKDKQQVEDMIKVFKEQGFDCLNVNIGVGGVRIHTNTSDIPLNSIKE